jgi:hypothetical protein
MAGQGSALAMIAAYVLAGELAKAKETMIRPSANIKMSCALSLAAPGFSKCRHCETRLAKCGISGSSTRI